jgi:hypothetical protein
VFDLRQIIRRKVAIKFHLAGWKEKEHCCTQSQKAKDEQGGVPARVKVLS